MRLGLKPHKICVTSFINDLLNFVECLVLFCSVENTLQFNFVFYINDRVKGIQTLRKTERSKC